jgi:hypothetical protein
MGQTLEIFEAIGDLETVISSLTEMGLTEQADRLTLAQDNIIDDVLDRGQDLMLEAELEDEMSELPWSTDLLEDETIAAPPKLVPKHKWKKVFRKGRRKIPKRWICATKPQKKRTRKGKQVWYSMVKYKAKGKLGNIFRIVSRDPAKRPREVKMGGKRLRWC